MSRKLRVTAFVLAVSLILAVFSGCESEKIIIDRNIILICQYTNYAFVPTNQGYVVDKKGIGYSFDFSSGDGEYSMAKIVDLFEENYDNLEGTRVMSESSAEKCYSELLQAENYVFDSEESGGFDMGIVTWCGVINDSEGQKVMISITQSGDWNCKNTDSHVSAVASKLEGMPYYYEEL